MKKKSIPLYYYPVAILLFIFLALSSPIATAQTVIQLPPTADAHVNQNAANYNYGACETLWVGMGYQRRTYMAFDVNLLSGFTINSATLSLTLTASNPSSNSLQDISVHKVTETWNEGSIGCVGATQGNVVRWDKQPAYNTTASATSSVSAVLGEKKWNLISLVQDWLNNPATNYGFVLRLSDDNIITTRNRRFASREATNPAERPKLIIDYNSGVITSRCQGVDTITFTAPPKAGVTYTYSMDLNGLWAGNTINPTTGVITFAAG